VTDDGSAVVDFALVGGLLSLLFLSIVQLGLVVHVRNTLVDCAAQGARYGARAGRVPADGIARTRELVAAELSESYAARLSEISAAVVTRSGVPAVEVRVSAPLPLVGLVGPSGELSVQGHAFAEEPALLVTSP
jgi:hypothetical protein